MRASSIFMMVVSVALLGCQKDEALPAHQGTTPAASDTGVIRESPPPVQTGASPPTSWTQTAPVAAPPAAGVVLASTEGEVPGLRIDITELKRSSGGTLNLKYVMTNGSSDARGFSGHWLGDSSLKGDYYGTGAVHLVDPVNKKKYFVVRDAENVCMCSRELSNVEPGQKVNLWAKFPAPPPDVQQLTIVIPHFTPIDDVSVR